jgi:hypothetical protein
VFRGQLQTIDNGCIQLSFFRHALLQGLEFVGLGQTSEPEQVADFLKDRVVGQIVDVVPAIGEHSPLTVDVADAGFGSDNPFQSLGGVQVRDGLLAGGADGPTLLFRGKKERQGNLLLYAKAAALSKRRGLL